MSEVETLCPVSRATGKVTVYTRRDHMTEPKRTRQLSGVNSLRALELVVEHPTGLGITEMSRKPEMGGAQCHRPVSGLRVRLARLGPAMTSKGGTAT